MTKARSCWFALALLAIGWACSRGDDVSPPAGADPQAPEVGAADTAATLTTSSSYGCRGEYRFVVMFDGGADSARVVLPDTTILIPLVSSGAETRYSDGTYAYAPGGDEARLETPSRSFTGCVSDEGGKGWQEAKARGVDFRAVGQEPGWILDIHDGDSIALVTDYGDSSYALPSVPPERDPAGRTVYRIATGAHQATIMIRPDPCRDAMSGWPYEATVLVTFDGREYRGCGRPLGRRLRR